VSALALSALSTSRFVFEGFLSAKAAERKKHLESLKFEERTMIFYEAPHKLLRTLSDMRDVFGEARKISLCRELTKLNEEIIRTDLKNALETYAEKEPRGEYVLVIEGIDKNNTTEPKNSEAELTPEEAVLRLIEGGMQKKDAIKEVAKRLGVPKSEIYSLFVND
jgi:16S rRNA (cytidine1402-2'-O)-methyltransferase